MPTVAEIWRTLTEWAPSKLAEPWDNIGLQVGEPGGKVSRLLVALDTSEQLLKKAMDIKAQLVITHHPVLFHPIKSLDTSKYIPRLLAGFLRSEIAILSSHTNLDSAKGGVNDILANALKLMDIKTLVESGENGKSVGPGRIGRLPSPVPLKEVIPMVASFLNAPFLQVTGDLEKQISTIALCGGSGSDLWPAAKDGGADLFISAEIKHHIAREAQQISKAIIDAGHFYTEWPIVPAIADFLKKKAEEKGWELEINIFEEERAPFVFFINPKLSQDSPYFIKNFY